MAETKVVTEVAGRVCALAANVGDQIGEGDDIILVEAMKMELPVSAPSGGTVKTILVKIDDVVGEGQIIAATVWKPETWGRGQRFRCLGLYGKGVKQWAVALREHVTRVAHLCGCNGLIADGREGWKVIFPDAKRLRAVFEVAI